MQVLSFVYQCLDSYEASRPDPIDHLSLNLSKG